MDGCWTVIEGQVRDEYAIQVSAVHVSEVHVGEFLINLHYYKVCCCPLHKGQFKFIGPIIMKIQFY